ncbi:MAG: hypothetical protein JST82_16550 [Bacteroidetes bacterium]|nr:hypothetical protein [Bacteroidota bacterium]
MPDQKQDIINALQKEWGLTLSGSFTEKEIIDALALKLAMIIEKGPDAFFQMMYRLDIPEKKLTQAMYDKNAVYEIAALVYNRQLQKQRSREYYKRRPPTGEEGLDW